MDSRPRRPSIVSNASMRQRKYSADRVLRQAEVEARLEEEVPQLFQNPSSTIPEDPHAEHAAQLDDQNLRLPSRVDTGISPFQIQPVSRVTSFPLAKAAGINTRFAFDAKEAASEPISDQDDDIEKGPAPPQRAETSSLDVAPAQAQIYRHLTRSISDHSTGKWFWQKDKAPRAIGESFVDGLHVAAAMHATIGLTLMAPNTSKSLKPILHVMEYNTVNKSNAARQRIFSCDSTLTFSDPVALKQHLEQIDPPAPHAETGIGARIIHIRNNLHAAIFVEEAFAMNSEGLGERGFRQWMQEARDPRRSSNMTIRWRPSYDIDRKIIRMAIGIDLGFAGVIFDRSKEKVGKASKHKPPPVKFPERRVALYLQRRLSALTPRSRVSQYNSKVRNFTGFAREDSLVICEYSCDALSDTRSLLALSPIPALHRVDSATVMASAISHVFSEVVAKWQSRIAELHQPFAELEERVHAQPADISHSEDVWEMSRSLQNMLKLASRHLKAIQTFQEDFADFAELDKVEWLDNVLKELEVIVGTIHDDFIQPLEHMIDLMYKSVTIRDSRLSLELGTSLWRLSWITFIFLPLTFLVGFFGMNVDTFQNDPSIKWYFVGLVPLAVLIGSFWWAFNQFRLEPKMHLNLKRNRET